VCVHVCMYLCVRVRVCEREQCEEVKMLFALVELPVQTVPHVCMRVYEYVCL